MIHYLQAVVLGCLAASLTAPVSAEIIEEIVVSASRVQDSPPGQRLLRRGDNLLLRVLITNDAREEDQRESEIHATLLAAIKQAARNRNVELSLVTDSGFVIPLSASNHRVQLASGVRPDTSQTNFRVKAAIPDNADGEALVASLKRFVAELTMTGRTLVEVDTDVEVSIVNPEQYRGAILDLFAADVRAVKAALGDDYRVVVTGLDQPVRWARQGSLNVSVFIPYEYIVVPSTISSIIAPMDY